MSTLSITENRILMAQARESLKGKWGLAIGTVFVYMLILIAIQLIDYVFIYISGDRSFIGLLISILITGPFALGLAIFALSLSRNQDAKLSQIFEGFQKYGVAFGAYILQLIFVLLWMILLIIPGIIAAIAYSQTYYILAEDDSIGPLQAITKSKEMMKGNKWKYFCLGLRFIGWGLLCILTLGIGYLWLAPYMMISYAKFYDDIAGKEVIVEESQIAT